MLLPASAAILWSRKVGPIMALSVALGWLADYAGLLVSYHGNLASGPCIVLAGSVIYALSLAQRAFLAAAPTGTEKGR
jgi:zinc/manganese transport system permease protein